MGKKSDQLAPRDAKQGITERALHFLESERILPVIDNMDVNIRKLASFLKKEYDTIPEKERIGKGIVFIARNVAAATMAYWKSLPKQDMTVLIQSALIFSRAAFKTSEKGGFSLIQHYAIILTAETVALSPGAFSLAEEQVVDWASSDSWDVRETCVYPIFIGLKRYPDLVFTKLERWARSSNANLRRLVSES
nr:hypothetical protein [Candidatus Sigynarchaeota archaeon]